MTALTIASRRRLVGAAVVLLLVVSTAGAIGTPTLTTAPTAGSTRAIATFGAVPTTAQATALRGVGLSVQPMKHLPLAILEGPVAALRQAALSDGVVDVYPDRKIELLDQASSDAMGAAITRAKGFTGKGVTVAVVDSGCDATHDDLADHVVHNVKLYSGEYVNQRDGDSIVVPVEQSPYNNSDIGSGHGTHVAGIIAADGTADPTHLGVAPDAELVCYSIGEILFTTAVVSAYDHMLDQEDLWGIDVVNNSWGNSFRHFDPNDPVAVATKAVADKGVTVVFAAGNSGDTNVEMSLNPFSQSPWVISVAASNIEHRRATFSSNGLIYDNSTPVALPEDGHTAFKGERIGIYHPDVTAPGEDISSTCDTVGIAIGPCPPNENAEASGTSMASPHVAGAAAVLKQANPTLTPSEVRYALQVTARPVTVSEDSETAGATAPFWQVGYGRVDLAAAVDLVRRPDFRQELDRRHRWRNAEILGANPLRLVRTDYWTYDAQRLTLGGSDSASFETAVAKGISHLKVTLSHPSLAVLGFNEMSYTVTIKDAKGNVVGETTEATGGAGTASVLIDLAKAKAAVGNFTFEIAGDYGASDPDTVDSASLLGETITLQVAQLRKR